jgi:isopentenyl-diphosphate delta-isomerase
MPEPLQQAEERKRDHIDLAFEAQLEAKSLDDRFYYEPLLEAHPAASSRPWPAIKVAGKTLDLPIWVSSMTGGTAHANKINTRLAQASGEMGMGMGLGSCRILLDGDDYLEDFQVRHLIGADQPLFANLGIAQLEEIIADKAWDKIEGLIHRLEADGLILHVNPMQEWFQPEGDRYMKSSLESIQTALETLNIPIIVKEVGQGMGKESLKALLKLPIEALDFGAGGGTNFALLEALRADPVKMEAYMPLARVGHSAPEMVNMVNGLIDELGDQRQCNLIIVSGGIKDFLDGYYCTEKLKMPAIYAQASALLKRAMKDLDAVRQYLQYQKEGLQMAYHFLRIKDVKG